MAADGTARLRDGGERGIESIGLEPACDRVKVVVQVISTADERDGTTSPTRSSRDKGRQSPIAPAVRRSTSSK